jgi:hydrogenase maturation protease
MKILVAGFGQPLRNDDSAGLEAVRIWQKLFPKTAKMVRIESCEHEGLHLLDLLEGMDVAILVDAAHSPGHTGKVIRLNLDEIEGSPSDLFSAHGWGVAESVLLGHIVNPALKQCRITLIGITGEDFGMGDKLTPPVRKALLEAASMIDREIQCFIH